VETAARWPLPLKYDGAGSSGVASATTLRRFRYGELGTIIFSVVLFGLVLLSGLGTLLTTSLSQPVVDSGAQSVTISMAYHSTNPGPFAMADVDVSVTLFGPNGSAVVSAPAQRFGVGAFATASGNLTFILDFSSVPQSLVESFRNGTATLTLSVDLSCRVEGLAHMSVVSSLELTEVG